ncbi:hypothetical protein ACFYY8_39895 [Streptosporangium sp. NPDC001559]|uniref:hypothetical protein n=1 Tax=Streptosporangium sp. NPDC001559 TaxID=3366187 RepID=UPI0036F0167A
MTVSTMLPTRQAPPARRPAATHRPITEEGVLALVGDWFATSNGGGPAEEILRHLVTEGLVLRLPEGTLRSHDEVRQWWAARNRDRSHQARTPKDVVVRISSPLHAEVTMSVVCAAGQETKETWSVVARDGAARIRTRAVLGPVEPR